MFQTLKFLKKSGPLISEAIHDSYTRCLVAGLLSPRLVDVQPSSLSQVSVHWGIQGEIQPSCLKRLLRPWFLITSCTDRQVLTLVSRSNNILRSNLLTGNSPTRSVFSDPCVNSMPQLLTWKHAVSAGHVHQRAAFPGNNLHPLHVSEPWLQCSRWQWSGLPQMCAIANTSLLH